MEPVILIPKYRKGKKPTRIRKNSKPIDGVNHRLLREQSKKFNPSEPQLDSESILPIDENLPPTREELTQKAKELGLKFNKRTSDDKLLAKINEVIGG